MKNVGAYVLIICLMLLLPACTVGELGDTGEEPSQGPTWQEQYDLGVRYLSEGNYEEAIIAFTAAIEIDPKQAPAYVGRGDAYVKSGETEENLAAAKTDYEKAIELDETSVEAYLGLADVYIWQGNYEKALEVLKRAMEKAGENQTILDLIEEIEATHIADEELEKSDAFVLVRQDIYILYNYHSWSIYTYDESGYFVGADNWQSFDNQGEEHCYSVTWTYDERQNIWNKTTINPEGTTTEVIEWMRTPGICEQYHSSINTGDGFAYTDPFDPNCWRKSFTAEYTYDENGNATRIDTYDSDGILSGYCILTWERIKLSVTSN